MIHAVLRLAEKKTQPLKPGGAWFQGLWEIVEYVSADKGRKHQVRISGKYKMITCCQPANFAGFLVQWNIAQDSALVDI